MSTQRVTVGLAGHAYDILIGDELLARAGESIRHVHSGKQEAIIITDENVAAAHLPQLEASLDDADITHHAITLPAGEKTKSFAQYEALMEALLARNPERKTLLIALGGGVIGDLTGFAASTLLRGVPFVQIPTTLLAQVDSSVGGKTAINSRAGKNLIGTFYQPRQVLADTGLLASLPPRQMRAGYAEVVKYGLINDPEFFEWLEEHGAEVLEPQRKAIAYAVKVSCQHKAAIVAEDEREGGKRALLNLGHTFGHALEAETGFSETLLHGEAVAIGMVMAFQLSTQLGLCDEADTQRVIAHLRGVGLPTQLSDISGVKWQADALLAHMAKDKKVSDGKLTFILARGIGKAFITREVATDDLANLLEACAKM